jgi:hypothetical protein
VLLGTDGAFGNLSPARIDEILLGCERGQELIETLFAEARDSGEEDNQTAIFYQNTDRQYIDQTDTVRRASDRHEKVSHTASGPSDSPAYPGDGAAAGIYTKISEKEEVPTLRERLFKRHQAGGRKT